MSIRERTESREIFYIIVYIIVEGMRENEKNEPICQLIRESSESTEIERD